MPNKYPLPEVVVKDECRADHKSLEHTSSEELNVRGLTLGDKASYGVTLRAEPDHKERIN